MKYIIDVPNQDYSYDKMLHTLKLKFYDDNLSCEVILDAEPYTEPDCKAIEDEVWGFLAFLIDEMDVDDKYECFGMSSAYKTVCAMSYQKAKAKYDEWKKQKDEIHVGDEVEYPPNKAKGIVVQCHVPDVYADVDKYAVFTGTSVEYLPIECLTKTGRVFPEVEELLKKMRSEEE